MAGGESRDQLSMMSGVVGGFQLVIFTAFLNLFLLLAFSRTTTLPHISFSDSQSELTFRYLHVSFKGYAPLFVTRLVPTISRRKHNEKQADVHSCRNSHFYRAFSRWWGRL